jgi:hypothetical protein
MARSHYQHPMAFHEWFDMGVFGGTAGKLKIIQEEALVAVASARAKYGQLAEIANPASGLMANQKEGIHKDLGEVAQGA